MKPSYKYLILCSIMIGLLTGCWDELNIEERGFVLGTAIDLDSDQNGEKPIVAMTNQFVVPSGIGSPGQGSGDVKAYNNITVKGVSITNIRRNMGTMTSRHPFYGHLKVLIFSRELAEKKNLIGSIADLFIRNTDMRRSMKVVIADGEAKNLLDLQQITEKTPANFLNMTMERNTKTMESIDIVRLGTLQSYLLDKTSYVLPLIKQKGDEIQTEGAGVFNGEKNKMIGMLNKKEIEGYNLITQKNKDGTIKIGIDGNLMAFQVDLTKSSIQVNVDNPKHPKVSIHIKAEGYLAEMFGSRSLLKDHYLLKINKKVQEKIKKRVYGTIEKSQKELNADILGVGEHIKHKHYDTWKELQDDWEKGEKYFQNATFDVSVEAQVEDTGATDRAKEKGRGE